MDVFFSIPICYGYYEVDLRPDADGKPESLFFCLSMLLHLLLYLLVFISVSISSVTSTLVTGQLYLMYAFRTCNWSFSCVVSHSSCVDMHSGVSVQVSIVLTNLCKLLLHQDLSSSQRFLGLCSHSGSTMTANLLSIVPGQVCMYFLYWDMWSRMYHSSMTVFLHLFEEGYQWFVTCNYANFMGKTVMMKFFYLPLNATISGFHAR